MDTLKSLANMTSTVHVLIGTHDLLRLTDLNAQLARRSVTLHFPRYHAEQPDDLKEFPKILRTFPSRFRPIWKATGSISMSRVWDVLASSRRCSTKRMARH